MFQKLEAQKTTSLDVRNVLLSMEQARMLMMCFALERHKNQYAPRRPDDDYFA